MTGDLSRGTELTVTDQPLILFDGECNLCNSTVNWILERDDDEVFRFGSLQWDSARLTLAAQLGVQALEDVPDSIVLLDEKGMHTRSTAALRIARRLGPPWSLAAVFLALPRSFRDAVYDWVARNRYDWFGKRDSCMTPTPELERRFLPTDGEED